MLHMQHHILCNISYVVIAESMGKSLKYTTNGHEPYKEGLYHIYSTLYTLAITQQRATTLDTGCVTR